MERGKTMHRNSKYCDLELLRFLGILLIMSHHLYLIGYVGEYMFASCWVWVDLYFMISGALTAKHFEGYRSEKENCGEIALQYTWHKFSRFFYISGIWE